jgi:hypothetical protein
MTDAIAGATAITDGAILIGKDVRIPLADGAFLSCNVFRSDGEGRVPPIIAFIPYGKDSDVAVDFKRYWDVVFRDHPEVVRDGSTGKYLTWEAAIRAASSCPLCREGDRSLRSCSTRPARLARAAAPVVEAAFRL